MSRKQFTLVVIIAVMAFCWWQYRGEMEPQKPATPPVSASKDSPVVTPRLSDTNAKRVDRYLTQHRMEIAACLLTTTVKTAKQLELTVTWDALGNFRLVNLKPDLGEEPKNCLSDLMKPLALDPSPDQAPFSFSKRLSLQLGS